MEYMRYKPELSNVYWIGGSPCSGKSTIAESLRDKYRFTFYHCDSAYDDHIKRSRPDKHPRMSKLKRMSWNEIWSRPIGQQLTEELELYREQFEMIVDDLLQLPKDRPILVEGAALLPEKVFPLLTDRHRGIWIVPTAQFQLKHYSQREWIHGILEQCEQPELAFQNWMGRDIEFAKHIASDAEERNLKVIVVDGSVSLDDNFEIVEQHFQLKNN